MRSFIYTLTFACLVGLAFWAYQENIKTKHAIAHAEKLQKEIGITCLIIQSLLAFRRARIRGWWNRVSKYVSHTDTDNTKITTKVTK